MEGTVLYPVRLHELPAPVLPVGRYRLWFDSEAAAGGRYLGSAWRGAFGHALKRAVCVTRLPVCADCLLFRSCAYPYIFETPPPLGTAKMRRYTAAPHPFALVLPQSAGEETAAETSIGVNLLGKANRLLAYVLYALERAGAGGVGPGRPAHTLTRVEQADEGGGWQPIYAPGERLEPLAPSIATPPPAPASLAVRLETPLRLKREEHLVDAEAFRFADLFASLLRRISMLSYFHSETPLETDFAGLTEASRAVSVRAPELRWHDWSRYSTRQGTSMQMGGLLGRFELDGRALAPFWPYLWLGQWTHAGKAASMGLGRYRIDSASLPLTD